MYAVGHNGLAIRKGSTDKGLVPVNMKNLYGLTQRHGVAGLDGEPVALSLTESVSEIGGWLPVSALIEGERGLWTVLRLGERDGNTVALREAVEVLHVYEDQAFVRGTLANGQTVVADGIHRVTPGTPVVSVEN